MRRILVFSIAVFCGTAWWCGVDVHIAHADAIGQAQTFFVNAEYDMAGASAVPATARAIGQHGYFYVDDRYWNALSSDQRQQYETLIAGLSSEFDGAIYPRLTSFWGTENTPGIDHDAHVVVFLEQLHDGSGGYFQTINNYTQDRAPQSNAHEMVYIDAGSVRSGLAKYFLAHEFQHLISFNQKELIRGVHEDVWLNEGRSEYSATVAGYDDPFSGGILQKRMWTFLQSPSDSLTEWPNTSVDYGITALFMQYLANQYGPGTVSATIRTTTMGTTAVDDALSLVGTSERMEDVFVDWMVAVLLNDRAVDLRFGYTSAGLDTMRLAPDVRVSLDASRNMANFHTALKEWQPLWFEAEISSGAPLDDVVTARVIGSDRARWHGAVIARYADGSTVVTRLPETGTAGTDIAVPAVSGGARIQKITLAIAQVSDIPLNGRTMTASPVSLSVGLQGLPATGVEPTPTPVPTPQFVPVNGGLIRRIGQAEIYVVWEGYRRYLSAEVLKLYGFQDRVVHEVPDDTFFTYMSSNYIRAENQQKVYAVWPDNTKHWLNITPTQWDTSGRDWGAIFTVNDAEVSFYGTGANIVR